MVVELETIVRSTLETIQQAGESIESAGRSVNRVAVQVEDLLGGEEGEVQGLAHRAAPRWRISTWPCKTCGV